MNKQKHLDLYSADCISSVRNVIIIVFLKLSNDFFCKNINRLTARKYICKDQQALIKLIFKKAEQIRNRLIFQLFYTIKTLQKIGAWSLVINQWKRLQN